MKTEASLIAFPSGSMTFPVKSGFSPAFAPANPAKTKQIAIHFIKLLDFGLDQNTLILFQFNLPGLRNYGSRKAELALTDAAMSDSFEKSPFSNLNTPGLPPGKEIPPSARKSRGRVDILRQTAGRGGKTVTVVANFVGIGLPEKEKLAKEMQKSCGTGGTVKDGKIVIQGDKREEVARILTKAGFRPVFAGG